MPGIGQVINYELPESAEWFTHRVGRTGRMGRGGAAITFLTPEDGSKWRQIEKVLGRRLARRPWLDGVPAGTSQSVPVSVEQINGGDSPRRQRRARRRFRAA